MTFLNFALVFGAAAAAAPVLIHLLSRTRARVIPWAAMHLLLPAIRKTRRRVRLEQLLLMLIRAAILALLALCMARPVLTGVRGLAGDSPSSVVILLDNSYSMAGGSTAASNFQRARDDAGRIIAGLRPGSEVALFTIGGGVRQLGADIALDLDRLNKALAQTKPGFGAIDLPAALEAAAATFGKMHHAQRELILLSDFQRIDWADAQADARQHAADRLAQMGVPARVLFFHAGAVVNDNVAVESLDLSPAIVGVGQPVRVRAGLRNFGERAYPDMRVYFRADGGERGQSRLTLAPGQRGQVLFSHTFDRPGSHTLEVYADADRLKADNSFAAAVEVLDRLPVLLVDGQPSREPLRGATDFLQLALQPMGGRQGQAAELMDPHVVDVNGLNDAALAGVRVVVLANVRRLDATQTAALTAFVRDGGGLLIFPGSRADSAWYNATLYAAGRGLLPAKLDNVVGGDGSKQHSARLVTSHFDHPALDMFNDPRNGNLGEAEFREWWRLESDDAKPATAPPKTDATDAPVLLARLDSGDPFLVEKSFGQGTVILAAGGCDAAWSDMPLRPFYLPLMRQLVVSAGAKASPPRNVEVGHPLIALLPAADAGKVAVLTGPDGAAHELKAAARAGHAAVEFDDTREPGTYTLRTPGGGVIHFVANTSRQESDTRQLTDAELQKNAGAFGATVVRSWLDYAKLDNTRRYGREIWRPLFWAVLFLAFGELIFEQWLTRRRA